MDFVDIELHYNKHAKLVAARRDLGGAGGYSEAGFRTKESMGDLNAFERTYHQKNITTGERTRRGRSPEDNEVSLNKITNTMHKGFSREQKPEEEMTMNKRGEENDLSPRESAKETTSTTKTDGTVKSGKHPEEFKLPPAEYEDEKAREKEERWREKSNLADKETEEESGE